METRGGGQVGGREGSSVSKKRERHDRDSGKGAGSARSGAPGLWVSREVVNPPIADGVIGRSTGRSQEL